MGRLSTLDRIRVLRKSLPSIRVDRLGSHLIIGYVGNSGKFVRIRKLYWSCVAEGLGGLGAAGERLVRTQCGPSMEAFTGLGEVLGKSQIRREKERPSP